jgi:hypothetical protein
MTKKVREKTKQLDVLQKHHSNMLHRLSEMKSQPKNHISSKNLRALGAAGIKSTQQKRGDAQKMGG